MKAKRILASLLAALMLTGSLASCAKGDGNTDEGNTNDSSAVTEEDTGVHDDLPAKMDFENTEVTIISRHHVGVTNGELAVDGLNGDAVNDAVFERNKAVESRLNISLVNILDKDALAEVVPGKVATAVQAGTGEYDLAAGATFVMSGYTLSGIYANLNNLLSLDLSKPYWSQNYNDAISYENLQFSATGAMLLATYRCAFVTVFNKALFTDANQPFLYDTVEKGEWTMDLQAALIPLFHRDNGNGKPDDDVYGFLASSFTAADAYWSSCDLDLLKKNADGDYELVLDLAKAHEVVEKMQTLYFRTDGSTYSRGKMGDDAEYEFLAGMFSENQGAMATLHIGDLEGSNMRNMEEEYGVIPMPKFNKEQAEYHTMLHDQFTVVGIPTTVKGDRLDMMGAVLEVMGSTSYKITRPVYYEETLRTKIAQDPQSAMMMDIIVEGIYIDPGIIYYVSVGDFLPTMRKMLTTTTNTSTSSFKVALHKAENNVKNLNKKLDQLVEAAEEAE